MSYCRNCGAELPGNARFCVSCGMPAGNEPYLHTPPAVGAQSMEDARPYPDGAPYSNIPPNGNMGGGYPGGVPYSNMPPNGNVGGGYPDRASYSNIPPNGNVGGGYPDRASYSNIPPNGNMGGGYPGGVPYSNMPAYGNGESIYASGPTYGNGGSVYANGQPCGMGESPYANGQPCGMGESPYANGQPCGMGESPYASGQPCGIGESPYAGGQPCGIGESPYANGQPCGMGESPYANGQAMNGMMPYQEMSAQADGYPVEDPYRPYGAVVQPQSSRKALAIIGMVSGLIVAVALILLIVVVTRDNSHRTYQRAVGVFMDGLKRQDMGRMLEAFPERLREDMRRKLTRYYDSEQELWEEYNDNLEWYCGNHVKMTYAIVQAEPLLEHQIRDYERYLMEDFQYDVSVSSGYEVDIEMTYKGSEGEYSDGETLVVAEIGGKWYVIGYDL